MNYARQHGLDDMAAAYRHLLDLEAPTDSNIFAEDPEEYLDLGVSIDNLSLYPLTQLTIWAAVFSHTWEMLQDLELLPLLVERLEASGWLQQSQQTFKCPGLLTPEEAAVSWVVNAASFRASGGVVVEPAPPSLAAQAAAAAANASSLSSSSAAAAAAFNSSGATIDGDHHSHPPALALPHAAMCALDLLTHALLSPASIGSVNPINLQWVISNQDVQLLDVMLFLGMPAYHLPGPDSKESPLERALVQRGADRSRWLEKATVIVEVCPTSQCSKGSSLDHTSLKCSISLHAMLQT
jgi:hypothetical protein